MSDISTVIFDLGGVYFTDGARSFTRLMESKYGIPLEKVLAVTSGKAGDAYRMGTMSPSDFWKEAKAAWGLDLEESAVSALWIDEYKPIPGTIAIIDRLNAAGYELLFLSDNAPDRVEYLDATYGFLKKFKGGVFSHIVGTRKPDLKIYEAALALTSSEPSACVYIDDKAKNVTPAETLGMKGITFISPEQLEQDLKAVGVRF